MTERELLRAAFQALLRGDTAERDRLCNLAKAQMDARIRKDETSTNTKPVPLIKDANGVYRVMGPRVH